MRQSPLLRLLMLLLLPILLQSRLPHLWLPRQPLLLLWLAFLHIQRLRLLQLLLELCRIKLLLELLRLLGVLLVRLNLQLLVLMLVMPFMLFLQLLLLRQRWLQFQLLLKISVRKLLLSRRCGMQRCMLFQCVGA